MADITHIELLEDLKTGRPIKIKVFNLGENLGQDFAYFSYYYSLRKLFPNVVIDLCRSNIDYTNCIGLENWPNKATIPVDSLTMVALHQLYPGNMDWVQMINAGHIDIFPKEFRSSEGYDYIWHIGMASSEVWLRQYLDKKTMSSNVVYHAVLTYTKENQISTSLPVLDIPEEWDTFVKGPRAGKTETCNWLWDRTLLEYLWDDKDDLPFKFKDEFVASSDVSKYSDYMRVSLRWPDNVRWYYSIEWQYEVLFSVIEKIKAAGKPVKIIYTLKDGWIGQNFNRGQEIDMLKKVQDMCDDILFIYSWPLNDKQSNRPSEQMELQRLRSAGITNIKKVDIWDDLLLGKTCKLCLTESGGYSEIVTSIRRDDKVYLFPTSTHHITMYTMANGDGLPVKLKVNQIAMSQSYACVPTLSEDRTRVTHWDVECKGVAAKIGDDCHGDDWKYFNDAHNGIFRTYFDMTKDELVNEVVKGYIM